MRAPPPVEFKSALGRAWRAALSLVVGASVAVPLAWGLPWLAARWDSRQPEALFEALGNPRVQGSLALWVAAIAVTAFWLASKRAAAGERTLCWDGQDWVLTGDAKGRPDQRGDAALMLDLGPWMLVRFTPTPGSTLPSERGPGPVPGPDPLSRPAWLPLTVSGDLARWAAFRGALWNWRAGRGDAR
jgi:hypothetical protein